MGSIKDEYGAYRPNLQSLTIASPFTLGPSLSGVGVPTGNPGSSFATYTDTATGIEYFWNGSVWTAITAGSTISDYFRSGDFSGGPPNFTPPGTYGGAKDTVTGKQWVYTNVDGWN